MAEVRVWVIEMRDDNGVLISLLVNLRMVSHSIMSIGEPFCALDSSMILQIDRKGIWVEGYAIWIALKNASRVAKWEANRSPAVVPFCKQ